MLRGEQVHLVVESLAAEAVYDVAGQPFAAQEGELALVQLAHFGQDTAQDFVCNLYFSAVVAAQQTAIVSGADAVLYQEADVRHLGVHGTVKHHAERAYIDALPRCARHLHELHLLG